MTGLKFARYVWSQTKTNATTYPLTRMIEDMNIVKDGLVSRITQINEDYFGMLAYRNLVAGQREYSLPDYVLNNIKYFEVDTKGDSDTQTDPTLVRAVKHKRCNEFDLTSYERSTDETEIKRNFQFRNPEFDIFRNALTIYSGDSIIDVINGLKLYYIRYPDDIEISALSNNTIDLSNDMVRPLSAGVPRQFHTVWATKVIVTFKNSKEKPIPLTQTEKNVENDLQLALNSIAGMNLDRDAVASLPYETGENY